MFLTRRLRITFAPKIKLIFFIRKPVYVCFPFFTQEALLFFLRLPPSKTLRTLCYQNPAVVEQCVLQSQHFFLYQAIQPAVHAELAVARVRNQNFCSLQSFFQATTQAAWFLQATSSIEISLQETCAEFHTLPAHQDEYHPQEPQGTEGFGVQEKAAEQLATHPVCPPDGSSDLLQATGSIEISLQETCAEYHTLSACQDEYRPQKPQGTEGFGVQERAAEQLVTHPVYPPDGSSDHQGSTGKPQDHAS